VVARAGAADADGQHSHHPKEFSVNITEAQLDAQVRALGHRRIDMVTDLAHEGEDDGIGPALVLALASRESNMRNIVGDGGHGRGWLQIDDRFHHDFLETHRGCDSDSFIPNHPSAAPRGLAPSLTASTIYAIGLLRSNMRFARSNGVPEQTVLRFAVAAYNAGAGGALKGFREGDVDRHTTGRDYAKDVLGRKAAVARILEREFALA
jgi:hypothetical protein